MDNASRSKLDQWSSIVDDVSVIVVVYFIDDNVFLPWLGQEYQRIHKKLDSWLFTPVGHKSLTKVSG